MVQCDHAICVQAVKVELKVGRCCLLQLDTPFASFLPVTAESGAEESGGLGGERRVDGEVFPFFIVAAYADDEGVKEVVATILSVMAT